MVGNSYFWATVKAGKFFPKLPLELLGGSTFRKGRPRFAGDGLKKEVLGRFSFPPRISLFAKLIFRRFFCLARYAFFIFLPFLLEWVRRGWLFLVRASGDFGTFRPIFLKFRVLIKRGICSTEYSRCPVHLSTSAGFRMPTSS